jgi:hypothetical protein
MDRCKLCDEKTSNKFNINFKAVPICEGCAVAITSQQVTWWSRQSDEQAEPAVCDTCHTAPHDSDVTLNGVRHFDYCPVIRETLPQPESLAIGKRQC